MPSRTSSTKLRTESSTPTADCRTEPTMPVGVNDWAFLLTALLTARTASAPTASPPPSHSRRRIVVSPYLLGGSDGPATLLQLLAYLGLVRGVAALRRGAAYAVAERGDLDERVGRSEERRVGKEWRTRWGG